ncbi:hypothetical protein [Shimia sp. SK013]|nr:hypothetical protein [Shimia sp. SK013]
MARGWVSVGMVASAGMVLSSRFAEIVAVHLPNEQAVTGVPWGDGRM